MNLEVRDDGIYIWREKDWYPLATAGRPDRNRRQVDIDPAASDRELSAGAAALALLGRQEEARRQGIERAEVATAWEERVREALLGEDGVLAWPSTGRALTMGKESLASALDGAFAIARAALPSDTAAAAEEKITPMAELDDKWGTKPASAEDFERLMADDPTDDEGKKT